MPSKTEVKSRLAAANERGRVLRKALHRLVLAVDDYAGEQFFADDNGMADTPEARRVDKAMRDANVALFATRPVKRAKPVEISPTGGGGA